MKHIISALFIVYMFVSTASATYLDRYMPQIPTGGPWIAPPVVYIPYHHVPQYRYYHYDAPRVYAPRWNGIERVYTVPGGMRYYFHIH